MPAVLNPSLKSFLADEARGIVDACTRCGKCVEVCPVVPYSDAATSAAAPAVAGNIIDFLADRSMPDDPGDAWLHACNGCGECIPACPEGVNPRKMLLLANIKDSAVATRTPQIFRKMARGVKLMVAMQLVPQEYARLFAPQRKRDVPLVFYLGCNALRTPHLLFNAMYVLDALEADYEVVGGPSSCCGVVSAKWEGELRVGERLTSNTIMRFEGYNPERVMNWCPTCQMHLGETLGGFRKLKFEFNHVTSYFMSRLDELRAKFFRPVHRRVVLHAHVGFEQVGRDVGRLLEAIPGLELVDTVPESGYTCGASGCNKSPKLQAIEHARLLDRVRETGADTLATLYHGCHASFVGAQKDGGFEVLNFTDLLVEALGGAPHEDRLKHYRLLDDWRMIVEEALPYLKANGLNIDAGWLEKHGPEIFALAEFKGGLDCVGALEPHSHG
jgi:Fe-S oxidoreductase